jgi:hypothetical protein
MDGRSEIGFSSVMTSTLTLWLGVAIVLAAFVFAGVAYWQDWKVRHGGRRTKKQTDGAPLPLTPLEMAVLRAHAKQVARRDQAALNEQIDVIAVRSRENTGAGFFSYFVFKVQPLHKVKTDTKKCQVTATINRISDALGFILWMKDGYVDCLEGYTLSMEHTADLDLAAVEFELTSAPPLSR